MFAQSQYTLSYDHSQIEFSVENRFDKVKGIEMFKEYPLDLLSHQNTAQNDVSSFGLTHGKSRTIADINVGKKSKRGALSRSIEEFLIDINIEFTNARGGQYAPSVAFDGTNYLIVWADLRNAPTDTMRSKFFDIYGVRVTPAGELLDSSNILISHTKTARATPTLAVAFDGVNYLVVWDDYYITASYRDIIGKRVTPGGLVLDPNGILISSAPGEQVDPSVTFAGQNYFVVWQDNRNFIDRNIYGARVTTTGLVLDPDGIIISSATEDQYAPCVATDGMNYFVTWADNRADGAYDIYGARVDQSGMVLDPQ